MEGEAEGIHRRPNAAADGEARGVDGGSSVGARPQRAGKNAAGRGMQEIMQIFFLDKLNGNRLWQGSF